MSLHGVRAPVETKCQNFNSLSDITVYILITESNLRKIFFTKTITILSVYLHHLGDVLDK